MKKLNFGNNLALPISIELGTCCVCDEGKYVAASLRLTRICGDCAQQIAQELSDPKYQNNG